MWVLPIFSPTVTTMRFQPTMVPRPSAMATLTFTQVGMKRVPFSSPPWKLFRTAASGLERPAVLLLPSSRVASPTRYMSLRRFGVAKAGTCLIEPYCFTCVAMSSDSMASEANTTGVSTFWVRSAAPTWARAS